MTRTQRRLHWWAWMVVGLSASAVLYWAWRGAERGRAAVAGASIGGESRGAEQGR